MSNTGKIIWDRTHTHKGVIIKESERYCIVCGRHSCYIVEWDDGMRTKPCTNGVYTLQDDEFQIK